MTRSELDAIEVQHKKVLTTYQATCDRVKQAERALEAARKSSSEVGKILSKSYETLNRARTDYLDTCKREKTGMYAQAEGGEG
jgi:hypothetical protein